MLKGLRRNRLKNSPTFGMMYVSCFLYDPIFHVEKHDELTIATNSVYFKHRIRIAAALLLIFLPHKEYLIFVKIRD